MEGAWQGKAMTDGVIDRQMVGWTAERMDGFRDLEIYRYHIQSYSNVKRSQVQDNTLT